MPGFNNLPNAIQEGESLAPLTVDQVKVSEKWSDDVALGIVLADINAGLAYEQAKSFITSIEIADDLVRGYVRVRPWP